ncbi:MAG: hypothetical protein WBG50_28815 [Desulfomonilaceae bacterium]
MVMMYQTMVLAFIALIAPVFAKSAGYELRRKPFECIGVSGLFFLLSVAFGLLPLTQVAGLVALWNVLAIISYFIAWIFMIVGAIWDLVDVLSISEASEGAGHRISEARQHT